MNAINQSIRQKWQKHGEKVEERVRNQELDALNWYPSDYAAISSAESYSLTASELRALQWLKGELRPKYSIRRCNKGLDFVYGNFGVEVKSSENYTFSTDQIKHGAMLEVAIVLLSTTKGVKVHCVCDNRTFRAHARGKGVEVDS